MKNKLIILLILAGVAVSTVGVWNDYQRRVRHHAEYKQWREGERLRQEKQQQETQRLDAEMRQSLVDLSKASAESMKKIEDARRLALEIAKDEARERERLRLVQMRNDAEDAALKASAEAEARLLGN